MNLIFFLYLKNDTERITLTYQPDAKYKYAGIRYFSDEPGEWNMRGRFQLIEDKTKSKSSETVRTLKGIYLDNFFIDKLDLNLVAHSVFGKEGLLEGSESVILPLENTIENRQNNIFDFDFAQKCEIRIDIEESIDLNGNSTFYENKSNQNKESTKNYIIVIRKISNIKNDSNSSTNMRSLDLEEKKRFTMSSFIKTIEDYCNSDDYSNPKKFPTFNTRQIFNNIILRYFGIGFIFPYKLEYAKHLQSPFQSPSKTRT